VEVIFVVLLIILRFVAPVLIVIGLVWALFAARRVYREIKSLRASRADEAAMSMEKNRIKARILKIIAVILLPAVGVTMIAIGLPERLASIMAIVCSGAFLGWSSVTKARYATDFKENFVQAELSKVFGNLQYTPDGRFDAESIAGLGFFAAADTVGGNDLIVADYKGLRFSQCDLGVMEKYYVTVEDSDGNTRQETRYRDVFRGRAMRFDFADKFRGKVQVISRDFGGAKVKSSRGGWQAVETELADFNDHFEVFAADPLDAMAALTPQMIEGIFFLDKALGVPMAFYFIENRMTAFLATGREAFDISGNKTLLEERALLKRDVALVTGFLDTMYFKPQEVHADGNGGAEAVRTSAEARIAAAGAAADAAAPSQAEKIMRKTRRAAGKTAGAVMTYTPYAIIAVYLASAVYALLKLPDGVRMGNSADAMLVPTVGYLVAAGFFIIALALRSRRSLKGVLISIITLAWHLFFLHWNL
jgi:hypothetical protein